MKLNMLSLKECSRLRTIVCIVLNVSFCWIDSPQQNTINQVRLAVGLQWEYMMGSAIQLKHLFCFVKMDHISPSRGRNFKDSSNKQKCISHCPGKISNGSIWSRFTFRCHVLGALLDDFMLPRTSSFGSPLWSHHFVWSSYRVQCYFGRGLTHPKEYRPQINLASSWVKHHLY